MDKKNRGPLCHIVKRPAIPWYQAWGIRLAALILALLFCAVVTMVLTGDNPISIYLTIYEGSFATPRRFWVLMQNLAILLCISLAMAPAFRMRFWNIGGEGQVMIGCLVCAAEMIYLGGDIPNAVLIILMIVSSLAAGAVWGMIPAFFKAKWNTNETLFTLMMNYVATQLVAFFIIIWESPKGSGKVGIINQKSMAGWLPSKHGYELAVVGESERTARYVGIKVGNVIVRTMALSGAICGLAGFLLVAGTDHTITTTLSGGRGFTAVMVAWMAKFNPLGMIFTSFLLVFLGKGAGEISTNFGLNQSFSDILSGIIIFFLIGCEFFISYRLVFRKGEK